MAFTVPPLLYPFDALEPHIDGRTMQIHHDHHHKAYVDKLNAALDGTEWADKPIYEVISSLDSLPAGLQGPVRNNGGGHCNHTLFWESLQGNGAQVPRGEVGSAINSRFGSLDRFKEQFVAAGLARFGSGWIWLVNGEAGLDIVSTRNQDTPLADGKTPLLGNDVWEHAYYLSYQNRRADYLNAFWNVVDWDTVAQRYAG
jgi:Fe-Mn family superoxide dismutase